MPAVEVKLALPAEVFRYAEQSANGAGVTVEDYLADVVRSQMRSEQDELAIEGYQALAEETLEFAASAMATVRETWPRWEETPQPKTERAASYRPAARNTCRGEVLEAANIVMERNGTDQFAMHEVVDELRQRGSKYAVNTIRTHVSSRMCANANRNHGSVSNDLERLDRGLYRLTTSSAGQAEGNGE